MPELEEDEQLLPLSEEERPTLGARIAGTAPPPVIAAAPGAPPPMPKPEIDMSKMPDAVKMLTGPASIPTPPTGSNNPNLADLARKQATLSTPINPVDPATHKTKPEYRMGIGQRILGTIANAATGFEGRGGDAVRVGPGATNNRFAREESQRQGELSGVNTQIGTQEKMDTENERMYRDAIRQAYESQVGQARLGTSEAQKETAGVRQQLEASQQARNEADAELKRTKAGQEPEPKTEAEMALAYQTALLKGDKANAARYKGALDELKRQKAAGKDTSASDLAKALQVSEFRLKEHDSINKEQETEASKRYSELDKNVVLKYNPAKMADEKAKIDAQLKQKYDPRHQDVDGQADKMLGLTKSGKSLQSDKPKAGASKIDPKNLPQQVSVGGKLRKVAGYNQKTGKVILAPEGQ